ncbi:histamine H2 receptor-like [Antedon mediterranea]|uniref:histamine H2 receptor-like n=1 Tax=Antedon mediterranea TaxID=105859 RepID=UPI003AF96097
MDATTNNSSTFNDTENTPPYLHHHSRTYVIITAVIFALIGIFGILGNALVIIVIEKLPPKNRSMPLYLLCAQAVTDLGASLLIIPVTFCSIFDVQPAKHAPILGHVYCRFIESFSILFIAFSLSSYNLTLLAYERYVAVVKPMVYKARFTVSHSKKLLHVMWVFAPLSQIILIIFQFNYDSREGSCMYNPSFGPTFQSVTGVIVFLWEYLIPVCIMLISYFCIVKRLRSQRKRIESWNLPAPPNAVTFTHAQKSSSHKVTLTLLACSAIYLICWTPNQLLFLRYNLGVETDFTSIFYNCTVLLVFVNSCRNPIIYALRFRKNKGRLKEIIKSK